MKYRLEFEREKNLICKNCPLQNIECDDYGCSYNCILENTAEYNNITEHIIDEYGSAIGCIPINCPLKKQEIKAF